MVALGPWLVLCLDTLGPFPETKNGNKEILNVVNPFTRFIVPKAVTDLKEKSIVQALEDIFNLYTMLVAIYADRGKEFRSGLLLNSLKKRGISIEYTPTGSHRLGGVVENSNRTLRRTLEKSSPLVEADDAAHVNLTN